MSRVRPAGSLIERTLGSALWRTGVQYRKQYKRLPGRPDFVVVSARLAIFCDSSFWHGRGWPEAAAAIKSNRAFWIPKIEGNIRRDTAVTAQLTELGWHVIRFWDDEILRATEACVDQVLTVLHTRGWSASNGKDRSHRFLLRRWGHDERPDSRRHSRPGGSR